MIIVLSAPQAEIDFDIDVFR